MVSAAQGENTTVKSLYRLKRYVARAGGYEGAETAEEVVEVYRDLHPLVREMGFRARHVLNQVSQGQNRVLAGKVRRGLELYEGVRGVAFSLEHPYEMIPNLMGSHRTVLFWEMVRFMKMVDDNGGNILREAYHRTYIAPMVKYHGETMQELKVDPGLLVKRWQRKVQALEMAGAKDRFLDVNRALMNDYVHDQLSADAALVLSLPYHVRIVIPIHDRLQVWSSIDAEDKEKVRSFYLSVQMALLAEHLKRRAGRHLQREPQIDQH